MSLTPEIRSLLLLTTLGVVIVFLLRGCEKPPATTQRDDVFGPIESFTTRRVPARDLLTR